MANSAERKLITYIGMPRGGKSFHNKIYMDYYTRGSGGGAAIVYNFGKPSDFPDSEYVYIKPLTFDEHKARLKGKEERRKYQWNPKINLFKVGNGSNPQIFHFRQFNELFVLNRRKIKMHKVYSRKEETKFFQSFHHYCAKTFICFDDCRVTLKHFNASHSEFFGRMNHAGTGSSVINFRGYGLDGSTIWHNADKVNSEIWDYTTDVVIFKTVNRPKLHNIEDEWLKEVIWVCGDKLKSLPKYSCFHINIYNQTIKNATIKL